MSAQSLVQHEQHQSRLFPVAIDSLDAQTLSLDLYLKANEQADPVLYRAIGVDFSPADRQRLISQGVEFLYIPISQHAAYRRILNTQLDRTFHDPETSRAERGRIIRTACTKMIEDVLLFPGQTDGMAAVADISRQFAAWSAEDEGQFSYLLDMSGHDYYTATHMVNVGVGCGLLFKAIKPDEPELQSLMMQGGLLHDIGKRGVPEEILNKEGRLEPDEWKLISKHPHRGYEYLLEHPDTPDVVARMAYEHHERPDGNGYPRGLKGDEIGLAPRICAVVDVFDAITACRPYRGPTPPDKTLAIMSEARDTGLDGTLLDVWSGLVEGLVREDPERAATSTGEQQEFCLEALVQAAPQPANVCATREPTDRWRDERRLHRRYECTVMVNVRFIQQGKPGPVKLNELCRVEIRDISQGGAQLLIPWAPSLNDVLTVELPVKNGRTITRQARIVRVRSSGGHGWEAGVYFMGGETGNASA